MVKFELNVHADVLDVFRDKAAAHREPVAALIRRVLLRQAAEWLERDRDIARPGPTSAARDQIVEAELEPLADQDEEPETATIGG